MVITANEIQKYMQMHNVDRIPVEVLKTEVPETKQIRQGARTLAKRLIITGANTGTHGGYKTGIEATRLNYVMYNSFKKSQCYVPPGWEFEVLTGELGTKMLKEYSEHAGNLEQVFRDAFAKHNPEIQAKLAEAKAAIDAARDIAEAHGIPFSPEHDLCDGMVNGYLPESFKSIFGDLDDGESEIIADLTGVYYTEYSGWQNSSTGC